MTLTTLTKRKNELETILKGKSHMQMVGNTNGSTVKSIKCLHEIRKELHEANELLDDLLLDDVA